jgi:hypothetical protein
VGHADGLRAEQAVGVPLHAVSAQEQPYRLPHAEELLRELQVGTVPEQGVLNVQRYSLTHEE